MDAEREADNMLAILNNAKSELTAARNRVQTAARNLERRGVDEDDVRSAKARVATAANDLSVTVDGLESAAEHVEE